MDVVVWNGVFFALLLRRTVPGSMHILKCFETLWPPIESLFVWTKIGDKGNLCLWIKRDKFTQI
jgi:hypothetical protein